MNDPAPPAPDSSRDDRGPQLSSRWLTIALLTAAIGTFAGITLVSIFLGQPSEPALPVSVSVERRLLPVGDGSRQALVPSVVIENESDAPIDNLAMSINEQYYFYRASPLAVDEPLVLPLGVFATKSNIRFDVNQYPVTLITVYGRLPSGRRGVYEYEPDHNGDTESATTTE